MYEDVGRYDEAEQMLNKAISLRPNDALGYMLLAGYYNRQGEFDKTIEAWKARAKAEPNNPEAWHTIAVYYFDKLHRDTAFVKTSAKKRSPTFSTASSPRTRRSRSTASTSKR